MEGGPPGPPFIAYHAGSVRAWIRRYGHRAARRRLSLRPVHPTGWWLDALMVAGFAVVTAALLLDPIRQFDLAIRDLADAHRPAGADVVAQLVNRLGSGGILAGTALVLALLLAWLRRSPWPVAPVVGRLPPHRNRHPAPQADLPSRGAPLAATRRCRGPPIQPARWPVLPVRPRRQHDRLVRRDRAPLRSMAPPGRPTVAPVRAADPCRSRQRVPRLSLGYGHARRNLSRHPHRPAHRPYPLAQGRPVGADPPGRS